MKVRELGWFVLAASLAAVVNRPAGAEDHRPSQRTLDAMGLGGLVVMSDDEAIRIRGQGFQGRSSVAVFGNSFATFEIPGGVAHSENGYAAEGKHFAKGKNFSQAGVAVTTTRSKKSGKMGGRPPGHGGMGGHPGGGHTTIHSVKVFAGGFSSAMAF